MKRQWLFEPADTLFFRNGLPFGFGHSVYLESIFPPTPESMQGVVRSCVLHAGCTVDTLVCDNCDKYEDKSCNIPDVIGKSASDLSMLEFSCPYLVKDGTRYFPAPLDIVKEKHAPGRIFLLSPSAKAIECDLGTVRFPEKPETDPPFGEFKPIGGWIRVDGLQKYLDGQVPDASSFLIKQDKKQDQDKVIYDNDRKVGIKMDYDARTAEEGNLYSISMVRLKQGIKIGVSVQGLDGHEPKSPFQTRFGGEGKVCRVEIEDRPDPLAAKDKDIVIKKGELFCLVFLSPACPNKDFRPFSPSLRTTMPKGVDCWELSLNGIKMRLFSACIDKAEKIGGWDVARKMSKPIRSLIPAGSVFYLEAMEGKTIPAEGKLGDQTQAGFGQYVIGRL